MCLICGYMIIHVFHELIRFIVSVSCFVKFVGQTSKNVHDVRNVSLETTLCVLACFVDLYVYVLDEFHVGGSKIVQKHIWNGYIQTNIPKDQPRVLDEGPFP